MKKYIFIIAAIVMVSSSCVLSDKSCVDEVVLFVKKQITDRKKNNYPKIIEFIIREDARTLGPLVGSIALEVFMECIDNNESLSYHNSVQGAAANHE